MADVPELRPATQPGEIETLTFDFGPQLGPGESISSVVSMLCAVVVGSDDAAGHFNGASVLEASPSTGVSSGAVLQQVKSMLGGNTYQFQCLVQTTTGQRLMLRTNLPCVSIPAGTS